MNAILKAFIIVLLVHSAEIDYIMDAKENVKMSYSEEHSEEINFNDLIHRLRSRDWQAQAAAIQRISNLFIQLCDDEKKIVLLEFNNILVNSRDPFQQQEIAIAAKHIGNEAAVLVPALLSVARNNDGSEAWRAIEALGEMPDAVDEIKSGLYEALKVEGKLPIYSMRAIVKLKLCNSRALETVQQLIRSNESEVQVEAIRTLFQCKAITNELLLSVAQIFCDEVGYVRRQVVHIVKSEVQEDEVLKEKLAQKINELCDDRSNEIMHELGLK